MDVIFFLILPKKIDLNVHEFYLSFILLPRGLAYKTSLVILFFSFNIFLILIKLGPEQIQGTGHEGQLEVIRAHKKIFFKKKSK